MYRNVSSFLRAYIGDNYYKPLQELVEYDFKDEAPFQFQNIDPIEKFNEYKTRTSSFDCDRCALSNEIYQRLYGWNCNKYKYNGVNTFAIARVFGAEGSCLDQNNGGNTSATVLELADKWGGLGSDTINSFQTTYNHALKLYSQKLNAVNFNKYINEFARLTHTIGNFTLVPYKLNLTDPSTFNCCRGARRIKSGNEVFDSPYYVFDYFDLSLKLIQQNVDFNIFKAYIDTFYLNDYVDENYNIKPLFKSHREFLQMTPLLHLGFDDMKPKNKFELKEYLKNVINLIQARGNRIVSELLKTHN